MKETLEWASESFKRNSCIRRSRVLVCVIRYSVNHASPKAWPMIHPVWIPLRTRVPPSANYFILSSHISEQICSFVILMSKREEGEPALIDPGLFLLNPASSLSDCKQSPYIVCNNYWNEPWTASSSVLAYRIQNCPHHNSQLALSVASTQKSPEISACGDAIRQTYHDASLYVFCKFIIRLPSIHPSVPAVINSESCVLIKLQTDSEHNAPWAWVIW